MTNHDNRDFVSRLEDVTQMLGASPGANSVLGDVQSFLSNTTVRRITNAAVDTANALSGAFEKPSIFSAVKAGFDVMKVAVNLAEIDPDICFNGDEWSLPYPSEFNQTIIDVMQQYPCRTQATTRIGVRVMTAELDGCPVSWIAHQSVFSSKLNEQVYVKTAMLDESRAAIRLALWKHYSNKSIVFKRRMRDSMSDHTCFTFECDEDTKPMHSSYARNLSAYLNRALQGGVSRSILLWGAPGTGKSCLARAVIDILNMRSLRLRVEDLHVLTNSTLADAIAIFAPDAVIIDDLDRLHQRNSSHLYEMLTFLKRNVKLVFGTVNDKKKVPAALRRPGRFDERRKIDVIDHEIVKTMLGKFVDDFDLVKNWPIVYVEEYANRRKYMAPEELSETVRELEECMQELSIEPEEQPVATNSGSGYYEEDD